MAEPLVVSYLPDPEQHPLWPAIQRLLEPATEGAPSRENELTWIMYDNGVLYGAATTGLKTDGTAQLRLAGGARHREWIAPLDEAVSDWARLCGASKLTMRGRRGWQRYAKRFGWAPLSEEDGRINFEKAL